MKHDHPECRGCEHELKFCFRCDAVECLKCKKEWIKSSYQSTSPFWQNVANGPIPTFTIKPIS